MKNVYLIICATLFWTSCANENVSESNIGKYQVIPSGRIIAVLNTSTGAVYSYDPEKGWEMRTPEITEADTAKFDW